MLSVQIGNEKYPVWPIMRSAYVLFEVSFILCLFFKFT